MCTLHDVIDGGNKSLQLFMADNQGRSDFEYHEIVPANLGKDIVIPEEPHDQHLPKHSRVYPDETFSTRLAANMELCPSSKMAHTREP